MLNEQEHFKRDAVNVIFFARKLNRKKSSFKGGEFGFFSNLSLRGSPWHRRSATDWDSDAYTFILAR